MGAVEGAEQVVGRVGHHLEALGGGRAPLAERRLGAARERHRGQPGGDRGALVAEGLGHAQPQELAAEGWGTVGAPPGARDGAVGDVTQAERLAVGAAVDPDVHPVAVRLSRRVQDDGGGERERREALEEPAQARVAEGAAVRGDEEVRALMEGGPGGLRQAQEDGGGGLPGRHARRGVARRHHQDPAPVAAVVGPRDGDVDVPQVHGLTVGPCLQILDAHPAGAAGDLRELALDPSRGDQILPRTRRALRSDGPQLTGQLQRALAVDGRREGRFRARVGGLEGEQGHHEGDARDQPAGAVEADVQHVREPPAVRRRSVESCRSPSVLSPTGG